VSSNIGLAPALSVSYRKATTSLPRYGTKKMVNVALRHRSLLETLILELNRIAKLAASTIASPNFR